MHVASSMRHLRSYLVVCGRARFCRNSFEIVRMTTQNEETPGSFAGFSIRSVVYLLDMLRHRRIQVRLNTWGQRDDYLWQFFTRREELRTVEVCIIVRPRLCAQIYCIFATLAFRLRRQSYANTFMWQVCGRSRIHVFVSRFRSRFELRLTTAACVYM